MAHPDWPTLAEEDTFEIDSPMLETFCGFLFECRVEPRDGIKREAVARDTGCRSSLLNLRCWCCLCLPLLGLQLASAHKHSGNGKDPARRSLRATHSGDGNETEQWEWGMVLRASLLTLPVARRSCSGGQASKLQARNSDTTPFRVTVAESRP